MAIEKADDSGVTYVGADGADHPLLEGKFYQGFYSRLGMGYTHCPGVVAYWDGDQFLDAPFGEEREMHSYDYLVERTDYYVEVSPPRPPKTVQQRFTDAILAVRKDIDAILEVTPSMKTADHCAANGAQWFKSKDYLRAHVWYLMAASYSLGQPLFSNYEEAADNARTLAFAEFAKGK